MTLGNFTLLDEEKEAQKNSETEKIIETPSFCSTCTFGPTGVHSCRKLEKYIRYEGDFPYENSAGENPECFHGEIEEINFKTL